MTRLFPLVAVCAFVAQACDSDGSGAGVVNPGPNATLSPSATTSSPTAAGSATATPSPSNTPPPNDRGSKGPFAESTHAAMKDPTKAKLTAPDIYEGKFETTAGDFVVSCTRSWAPNAADRFFNLLKIGFYDDVAIYRVHPGFVAQWGLHGNPAYSRRWQSAQIEPDPITQKNKKGTLTFAQAGSAPEKGSTPLTRATQVFINYKDNEHLDEAFAPVCKVTQGFSVTKTFGGEKLHEQLKMAQGRILAKGNAWLRSQYPQLDYIKKAYVLGDDADASTQPAASGSARPADAPAKP